MEKSIVSWCEMMNTNKINRIPSLFVSGPSDIKNNETEGVSPIVDILHTDYNIDQLFIEPYYLGLYCDLYVDINGYKIITPYLKTLSHAYSFIIDNKIEAFIKSQSIEWDEVDYLIYEICILPLSFINEIYIDFSIYHDKFSTERVKYFPLEVDKEINIIRSPDITNSASFIGFKDHSKQMTEELLRSKNPKLFDLFMSLLDKPTISVDFLNEDAEDLYTDFYGDIEVKFLKLIKVEYIFNDYRIVSNKESASDYVDNYNYILPENPDPKAIIQDILDYKKLLINTEPYCQGLLISDVDNATPTFISRSNVLLNALEGDFYSSNNRLNNLNEIQHIAASRAKLINDTLLLKSLSSDNFNDYQELVKTVVNILENYKENSIL